MGTSVLEARDVVAGYGKEPVVREVNIRVEEAEIVAVLGPNGAGKSTLLKALAGEISLSSGSIVFDGEEIGGLPGYQRVRRGLGYVPQVQNVFGSLSVRENLEIGSRERGGARGQAMARVVELFPDLGKAMRRGAATLSGGQRSMLALARALMGQPRLLVVDEPTAGLAPQYQATVWRHLCAVRNSGVAVAVVEQNTAAALKECDRAYILVGGRNRLEGSGKTIGGTEQIADLYLERELGAAGV